MNKALKVALFTLALSSQSAWSYYGPDLCAFPQYECMQVTGGTSWDKLFPDPVQRDIVQRVNRTYNPIWSTRTLAVPKNLAYLNEFDVAPFPLKLDTGGERQIIVDQDNLAWAAYDAEGYLLKWGPISSGRDKCSDSNHSCRTMTGIFRVFSKENVNCKSDVFPIGKGGAKMPYCMYFHKGFALHGADDIPGYRASHGCIRMFTQDAKWLNENFVELSSERNNFRGTTVIVRPLNDSEKKS